MYQFQKLPNSIKNTTKFFELMNLVILFLDMYRTFGVLGYFMIDNAAGLGKYLFVTLVALVIASFIGIFLNNPIFHTIISVIVLTFLLYNIALISQSLPFYVKKVRLKNLDKSKLLILPYTTNIIKRIGKS